MPGRSPDQVEAMEGAAQEGGVAPVVRMNRARRLKRVFRIDIEKCEQCGGRVKVIASI